MTKLIYIIVFFCHYVNKPGAFILKIHAFFKHFGTISGIFQ